MAEFVEKNKAMRVVFWDEDAMWAIKNLPASDVRIVKHGKNSRKDADGYYDFACSECGTYIAVVEGGPLDGGKFNYCPNCGAKMDGE